MNPQTNHLVDVENMTDEEKRKLTGFGYEGIPQKLNRAARRKLAKKKSAYVSFNSGGKLSKWAADRRKQNR